MSLNAISVATIDAARDPLRSSGGRITQHRLRNGRFIVCISVVNAPMAEQQALANEAYEILSTMDQPFAIVMDMRNLTDYPSKQRQVYAEVRERLRSVYERLHKLTVYLVESDAQRGFVIAVGWKAKASPLSGRIFTDDWNRAYALCEQALLEEPAAAV